MSLPELRFRIGQKLRIARELWALGLDGRHAREPEWWHLWNPEGVGDPRLRSALSDGNAPQAAALLPGYFAARATPQFYFAPSDRPKLLAAYRQSFPGRIEQLRGEVEVLCAHRLHIFGYPAVQCGTEISWRRDLVHNIESGLRHWSRLPYLDFEKVGDSKIVWEPNRHQHFFTLSQSYLLTGDEAPAEECFRQLEHWQRENPYLRGINWASSLEVAFRAWSWLWALFSLRGSQAVSGTRLARMTRALAHHAEYIAANLSVYSSPNTHLLGEAFGLFAIGLLLPELRGAQTWQQTGWTLLLEQIQKQVREDGSHIEQSSYYHHYATDFFLCATILAERNACPFPMEYRQRLERMVEFMVHTSWPSGRHPMIGDADGGRLLELSPRDPNDQRGTLSTAAIYFRRGDFRSAADHFHEETLWLLGPRAVEEFALLQPAAPRDRSRLFPDAGVATMRDAWERSARMLLFDAGPQGMGTCAHGHADTLSLVCSADGVEWLVDPGTFVYTTSRPWRDFFRSIRAHNTVMVDGRDQAEAVDVFKWRRIPKVLLERWASLPHFDMAIGLHKGYARLRAPVIHRRSVFFVKPDYWVVSDEFTGRGAHRLEFFFHFTPGVDLKVSDGGWLASKNGARLLLATDARVEFRLVAGEKSPIQGWYSEDYGHRKPAPVLVGTIRAAVPVRFAWLLWAGFSPWPKMHTPAPDGSSLTIETDAWTDFLGVPGTQEEKSSGELSTDAEAAFVRWEKPGRLGRLTLLNGRRVALSGKPLVEAAGKFDRLEAFRKGESFEIQASPAQIFRLYAPGITHARLNGRSAGIAHEADWVKIRGED